MKQPGPAWLLLALTILTCAPALGDGARPAPLALAKVTELIALGDSYLDNGAALAISRAAVQRGIPGVQIEPGDPAGGVYPAGRWTNGPTAVELLAQTLGVPLRDLAVGGAKSGDGNYYAPLDAFADTGLLGQVAALRAGLAGARLPAGALIIVAASANDYFQFHDFHRARMGFDGSVVSVQVTDVAESAARNVARAVLDLSALGARRIVVSRAYYLEGIPNSTTVDPQIEEARDFAQAFNRALDRELAASRSAGTGVLVFDWGALTRSVASQPERHGIRDVARPCQATVPAPSTRCANPDDHLWWDEWHESARMHRIVAEALRLLLGASVMPGA
jgi:phospholipase/lecithinase/hemolysin